MSATEYQRRILADGVRNDALAKALQSLVKSKDTVIDIGVGTGFLAILALRYGAKHVTCIEREEESVRLCRDILRANKIKNCTVIHASSFDVRDLPAADLILCETLGNFAYEEGIIETMRDAQRFLKPGGRILPQHIAQFVAPVTSERFFTELQSWTKIGFDIHWHPGFRRSLNNMYVRDVTPSDVLDDPKQWDDIDCTDRKNASIRKGTVEWQLRRSTVVYGFALSWTCTLAPGIELQTSPSAPKTHWQQIYLPVEAPMEVKKGESVRLTITSDTRREIGTNVAWDVTHTAASGRVLSTQSMDMRRGY